MHQIGQKLELTQRPIVAEITGIYPPGQQGLSSANYQVMIGNESLILTTTQIDLFFDLYPRRIETPIEPVPERIDPDAKREN